ncbi:MAG: hypothetical protein ACOX5R_12210 [bacterium]
MQTHVKIASILHICFGIFGFLTGLIMIFLFGSTFLLSFIAPQENELPTQTFSFFMLIFSLFGVFTFLSSVPAVLAGIGMLNYYQWGRILGIIISILYIPFHIPLGTMVGVYSLWVLFSEETVELFNREGKYNPLHQRPPAPPPSAET